MYSKLLEQDQSSNLFCEYHKFDLPYISDHARMSFFFYAQ